MRTPRAYVLQILGVVSLAPAWAFADNLSCTSDGQGNDHCDILLPNVLAASTDYPTITFQAGDTVRIAAEGCAQTGGSGNTWKRIVLPSGPDSDHLYSGLISIPGVTNGLVPLAQVVNNASLPASTGGWLTLGYQDGDFSDNGYWSHDDGTEDQCKDQSGANRGRAAVHLDIHRAANPLPAGAVYGHCTPIDALRENCHIDRPDVTVAMEPYPSIRFCPGDAVVVQASGCVQTGGSGDTWKRYVNPSGDNSDHLYHGLISIPGVTQGLVRLQSVVGNSALPASTGGSLSLGYEDDDLSDNGYWSHDDGTENQCQGVGAASLDIGITHARPTVLGCSDLAPVTGTTPDTVVTGQSETAATVVQMPTGRRVVVTFNDLTQPGPNKPIVITPGSRNVFAGASLMGWAVSDDDGRHWSYAGKLGPPPDWPVYWGDPAIVSVPDPSRSIVFLSNLAVPTAEFVNGANITSVGGACLERSTDGASSFAFFQCLSNTDPPVQTNGHFYDGESLAATPDGAVYAGFEDTATGQIDLWRAPNADTPFTRLPSPFPRMMAVTHARLRGAADGSLYAASAFAATLPDGTTGPFIYINRYVNGAWGTPQRASNVMVASLLSIPTLDLHTQVQGSELTVRMGPQYAFAVGSASAGGQDAVRVLVTRRDAATGRLFIEGNACAADLSACHPVPEWHMGPTAADGSALQAFDPVMQATPLRRIGRWPLPAVVPATWIGGYYLFKGDQGTAVQTGRMYLNYQNGVPIALSVEMPDLLTVCSDSRGYWGDYNDMVSLEQRFTRPSFLSFVSRDQQLGCISRGRFLGVHQHVDAVHWNP
jgi:hypothetical protein